MPRGLVTRPSVLTQLAQVPRNLALVPLSASCGLHSRATLAEQEDSEWGFHLHILIPGVARGSIFRSPCLMSHAIKFLIW